MLKTWTVNMANRLKEVEDSIRKKIGQLKNIRCNPCIYKVPEPIKNVRKQCYEPLVVSIGPFYHKKKCLEPLQDLKLRHLECLIEYNMFTTTTITTGDKLGDYLEFIGTWEEELRSYYAEEINISSNEFIEMVMIDTAFIIYLFICFYGEIVVKEKPLRYKHEMVHHIQHDIFLEENQLPYFILKEGYEKSFGAYYPHISFKDIALNFINGCHIPGTGKESTNQLKEKLRNESDIKHLVDFLRICCLPSNVRDGLRNVKAEFPPTAKELKAAGMEFRCSNGESLLDIKYKNGVLEIPKLIIQDSTESIFRSILFYEYCHHYYDSYVLDYVVFLDELIDTSEDVEILVKSKVLEDWLGNHEEVANTINRIVKNIMIYNPNFYYSTISRDLKKYASKRIKKYKAILRRNYFNHPWSIVSVIYLIILLILAALQVAIAIYKK